jgi:hypothetical protein
MCLPDLESLATQNLIWLIAYALPVKRRGIGVMNALIGI